jgi:cytoskeletal protein CcmA (bactofilin family)
LVRSARIHPDVASRRDQKEAIEMDSADQQKNDKNPTSMIGSDIVVTGNIEAQVDLHIEGRVQGDVRCATLILGESSEVKGSIYADRVRVSGKVDGAIECKDLAVEATAQVTGDVLYERLRVANGGVVEGHMRRRAPEEGAAASNNDGGKLKLVEPPMQRAEPPRAVFIE